MQSPNLSRSLWIQQLRAPTKLPWHASSAALGLGLTTASRCSGFWHYSERFWREAAAVGALSIFWREAAAVGALSVFWREEKPRGAIIWS